MPEQLWEPSVNFTVPPPGAGATVAESVAVVPATSCASPVYAVAVATGWIVSVAVPVLPA